MIEENKFVLLRKNDVYKAVKFVRGKKVKFERTSFLPDPAIGQPFGSIYEINRHGNLVPAMKEEEGGVLLMATAESSEDNRKIIDDGTAQRLSHEDIHEMKKQGISGQAIMESVVQGSTSFKDRTKYSQEKYVKKKVKRHTHLITILQPSTRLLCHMYYAKGPSKICHLRMDTLGQMLTLGNVHAHSNIVVMETCQGLLTGAILERIGGHGTVVQVYFGDKPVKVALEQFGHLSDKDMSCLLEYPLHKIYSLLEGTILRTTFDTMIGVEEKEREEQIGEKEEIEEETAEEEGEDDGSPVSKKRKIDETLTDQERKRKERDDEISKAGSLLMNKQMDGLLVACRFHPQLIVESLLHFIAPSRPVVVYCQFHEPLVQCYQFLKESGKVFNLQLTETWWRTYQVLPDRTHPSVNMDGQSGYLLSGTTICHDSIS